MRTSKTRAAFGRFLGSEAGSAGISAALFVVALASLCIMAILGAVGVLHPPRLIYLVLVVAVVAAGWDLWRERRKGGGR